MHSLQSTTRIIMLRPACFCFNTETASSNQFQGKDYANSLSREKIHEQALHEFNGMVEQLRLYGIYVDVFDDTLIPIKPDAIFLDNWFTTHRNGTIILYPMFAENRRMERRLDIIQNLSEIYHVNKIIDLSIYEQQDQYLEGTGSLVFDHLNKTIYAIRSPRTDEKLLEHMIKLMNDEYSSIIFDSIDENHNPIFHTNVMMSIGTYVVIICLESISDQEQRDRVIKSLEKNNQRKIIDITLEQMKSFAGNMIELQNEQGECLLCLSKTAYNALTDRQRDDIEKTNTKLVSFDVSTIEQCGGGSVRCMIAENFLSKK